MVVVKALNHSGHQHLVRGGWSLGFGNEALIRGWEALIAAEGCRWWLGSANLVVEGVNLVPGVMDPLGLH